MLGRASLYLKITSHGDELRHNLTRTPFQIPFLLSTDPRVLHTHSYACSLHTLSFIIPQPLSNPLLSKEDNCHQIFKENMETQRVDDAFQVCTARVCACLSLCGQEREDVCMSACMYSLTHTQTLTYFVVNSRRTWNKCLLFYWKTVLPAQVSAEGFRVLPHACDFSALVSPASFVPPHPPSLCVCFSCFPSSPFPR